MHVPNVLLPPSRISALLALGLLASGSVTQAAQENPGSTVTPTTFEDAVNVTEVLLDVVVTDRKGNVILGLGPEDFVIEEKQRGEIPVRSVSFYSNRFELRSDVEEGELQHPAPHESLADRYFILFFDDVKRLGADRRLVRQQFNAAYEAKRWIDGGMLQGDWVAIASWDSKLKIHQDFTRDRALLHRAVDQAALGKDPTNIWPSRRPERAPGVPTMLRHLPRGWDLQRTTPKIYDALEILADATREIVGRKNLLLFTLGFGELSSGLARPDHRYYSGMIQTMNDRNVAVYPIDLVPPEWSNVQGDFLQKLALDTGGVFWDQFVSFATPFDEISDESSGYYLLSYRSERPAGEAGYQEVRVKARDRSFRVRSRGGYLYGGEDSGG